MTERLDGGEILAQRRIPVPPEEDTVDISMDMINGQIRQLV